MTASNLAPETNKLQYTPIDFVPPTLGKYESLLVSEYIYSLQILYLPDPGRFLLLNKLAKFHLLVEIMTSYVAKLVSKRILGETLQNKFGEEVSSLIGLKKTEYMLKTKQDPYFEHVPATRLDGRPSKKMKKRKKALPPGISENDGKVLTKAKRRAHRLDMCLFNFLGVRFGWSSVIALVPVYVHSIKIHPTPR